MFKKANNLKKIISQPKNIVITTHRGPDGDAMGSSLALYNLLINIGHKVNVITPNDYASFLNWMPGNDTVIEYDGNEEKSILITSKADIIFMLDFNSITRLDNFSQTVSDSKAFKVLIDHHQDPDMKIADLIFSDSTSCSTAQLLYELIEAMNMTNDINMDIAECLYVGIMTDTGSFKYNSTTSRTHNVIANLIDKGARNSKIHDLIYDNSSADRMKLLGYCINDKLLLYPENNAAIISLTDEELNRFNFKKGDTEGIINYALAIKGIIFAVLIVQRGDIVKLSLRSKGNFKVNLIANKYFNGGGHTNASGGMTYMTVNETIKKVESIINKYKKELNN
ncbi:MAG: bifunctional oligoribonuclease/PAP phosphatase NrnA [Flavobacteriales bacterium]|jgi:bifunctional oligoribonuclease and PAP phosphatase NrnA|nr:bifunctional oligoribonuclease/PAP phosphatase NrnA [Flavobacteriales bacterium]